MFAALEVASEKIIAARRPRRVEFLDFMSSVIAAFPGRKLTSSSTTSIRIRRMRTGSTPIPMCNSISRRQVRLAQPRRGMIFGLAGQSLGGTSFASLKQLQEHIDA
jgi:hypothetical protein